jgi:hypothetical protein
VPVRNVSPAANADDLGADQGDRGGSNAKLRSLLGYPAIAKAALAVAAEVAQNFHMESGAKSLVVVKVLDGQPHDGNSAALPLQVAVTVIDVAPRAAMVGTIRLHDQDMSSASHKAPCVA